MHQGIEPYINDSVVFIMATTHLEGNELYILYKNQNFIKFSSSITPSSTKLFFESDIQEEQIRISYKKLKEFEKYLDILLQRGLKNKYSTPSDIMISDGTQTYLYIHLNQQEKRVCIEPEALSPLKEIIQNLDKVFE